MYKINYGYSENNVRDEGFYKSNIKQLKRILSNVFGSDELTNIDFNKTLSSIDFHFNNNTSSVYIYDIDKPNDEMLVTVKILDDSFENHKDYVTLRDLCIFLNSSFFKVTIIQPKSEELIVKDESSEVYIVCVNVANSNEKGFIGVNYMVKADNVNTAERKACLDAKIPYSHTNPTGYACKVDFSNDLQYLNDIGWTVRD